MARISYIQEQDHPELAGLIERVRGGRDGRLLNPYRMLLHSPDVATSWFEHIGAVRWKTELSGVMREIAIIRVGILNDVPYVVKTHLDRYALQDGMTQAQCDTILDWESSDAFDASERAVLAYTDAMTGEVHVADVSSNSSDSFQRAADPGADRPYRHVQHAHARTGGAPGGSRGVTNRWCSWLRTIRSCGCFRSSWTPAQQTSGDSLRLLLSHDLPDFDGWLQRMRGVAGPLYPAEVRLVDSRDEMRAALDTASVLVVESLEVGQHELAAAPEPRVVQKFGALPKNVDLAACAEQECAGADPTPPGQHLMCRAHRGDDAHSGAQIPRDRWADQHAAAGGCWLSSPGPFDRRHTAMSGWPSVSGLSTLYESSLGIIGMGEIGQELAVADRTRLAWTCAITSAAPLSAEDESRLQVQLCVARRAAGRERLGMRAASR